MNLKVKVLSLAVATVLAGCAGAPQKDEAVLSTAVPAESLVSPVAEQAAPLVEATVADVVEESASAPADSQAEVSSPAVEAPAPAPIASTTAPQSKPQPVTPSSPNTFIVGSYPKTGDHPAFGRGTDVGFVVNGKEGADVVVTRGEAYKFEVDTGVQHDFYLTTNPAGWGVGAYTNSVEGQFIYKGTVDFKPDAETPDLLYYQCRNHKYMGGKIYVLDKGESLAQLKQTLEAADAGAAASKPRAPARTVSESSVKQKLGYAKMVLSSGSAKRVEASGNAEAIATLKQARDMITGAQSTLDGGSPADAMDQVDEGLRLVTAASRMITTESEMAGVNHKAQHEELLNSLSTYEKSYARNMERIKKAKQQPKKTLDEAEYNRLVGEGKDLGGKGDYVKANKALEQAQALITSVLTDMLHAQTVVYDKNFESPKEEYEYELARLESYEELVPLAIDQKQPKQRTLDLVDGFVEKAAKIKGEGLEIAAKGDYKMAIMAMQAATSNIQRALRMMGVN